jgi:hypothetical protein
MTDATSVVISAVIAATVGFITALITTYLSFRNLKLELRANYRSELAKRQIEACEEFWEIFGPTSTTDGEHRIIRDFDTNPVLDMQETEAFIARFQETFTSKAGLYLSKPTRSELHKFRDMLIELKNEAARAPEKLKLTRMQADKVKTLRTAARLALREEVGSTNLTVANTEYKAY